MQMETFGSRPAAATDSGGHYERFAATRLLVIFQQHRKSER